MKKILTAVLLLLFCGASHSLELVSVSADAQKDADLVIIELSFPAEPKVFNLKEPDRIVIDINGAVWEGGKRSLETKSGRTASVRWAQNSVRPDNVRVVIDLKQAVERELILENGGRKIVLRLKGEETPSVEAASPPIKVTEEAGGRRSLSLPVTAEAPAEENGATEDPGAFTKIITPSSRLRLPELSGIKGASVFVNGKKLDTGRKPVFIRNILMVPAGSLLNNCGFDVAFDKKTKVLTAVMSDEIRAVIKEGSNIFTVNGTERRMPVPARKISGRLYVPLISIVKWTGFGAFWEKSAKRVYIAPRVTKIAWEEVEGSKAVVIGFSSKVSTYEAREKEKPLMLVLDLKDHILDAGHIKIPVKEEGIRGIKAFQSEGSSKIGIYLESRQSSRIRISEDRIIVSFPPAVNSVTFTEEGPSVRIDIQSTKPVLFETRRLPDPERLIIDMPGAVYAGPNHLEIGKGGVLRVRASQFKTDPLAARVVVDLAFDRPFNTALSDDNTFFAVRIEKAEGTEEKPVKKSGKISILKDKVIVIDPGHGGLDPGAFGISGDRVKEKDLNLATAVKLSKMLSEAGAVPLMTREEDQEISLAGRVEFAKNNKADILVCMHYNSSFKSDISGTETYYYNPNSKLLASLVHRNIVAELGRQDRGLSQVKFFVVFHSPVPSVLVEPVYLSNGDEERLALDPAFQEKVAKAIFEGVKQYFEVLKKIG